MQHCNPCRTPVDTESKLGSDGDPVSDPTLYRSLAGALQYLTFTRPDISMRAYRCLSLYAMDQRCSTLLLALSVILRYVRGTHNFGLHDKLPYLDLVLWSEYRGVANVVAETAWIRKVLLGCIASYHSYSVYCDNVVLVRVLHYLHQGFSLQLSFTKGFPSALFCDFRSSLNVRRSPVLTAVEY
ncbi:ribonuclease H-like domain-containing protein [Tanacetum coccineum]